MQIDISELDQQNAYKIIIGCIVPRPIAWVSTVDEHGSANLAPFSFFNAVGANPPALSLSIMHTAGRAEGRKDTLHNIITNGQFVVNLVNEQLAPAMNITATDVPADVDEFALAGLEAAPSTRIRPPRVAAAAISFECALLTTVPVGAGPGSATLVIGQILVAHVRDDLDDMIDARHRVDLHKLQPVARLAGNDYAYVRETFTLVRPKFNSETGMIEDDPTRG